MLDCLRADAERLFGSRSVAFEVRHASERETSTVARVQVSVPGRRQAIFLKRLKPKDEGASARADARARLMRDWDVASRAASALSADSQYGVVRPLACYPEQLAIVTPEVPGETLLQLIERRARWWPSAAALRALGEVLMHVGGWVRAFQGIDTMPERFSLDAMRAYADVRLRRLLATNPPVLDDEGRARVLDYFDRTAASVDAGDLRQVLTHADLAPSNVIVERGRVTVIDFAMAAPGGVFMDVARLYTQLDFLTAKPKFRPAVIRTLQARLLRGFDPSLEPERPLFRLFVLQHVLCHMSNIARNPAPPLARMYNRHQLRLRQQWLHALAA